MTKVPEAIFKDFSFDEKRRVLKWIHDKHNGNMQTDRSTDLGVGSRHIDPQVQKEYDERINSGQFNLLIDYLEDLGLLLCLYKGKQVYVNGTGYIVRHRVTAQGKFFLWLKFRPLQWCYLYSDAVKTAASAVSIASIIVLLALNLTRIW